MLTVECVPGGASAGFPAGDEALIASAGGQLPQCTGLRPPGFRSQIGAKSPGFLDRAAVHYAKSRAFD